MPSVNHDLVKSAFEKEGYTLLDTYTKSSVKMKFICSKGHHHKITWNDFQQGTRCRYCSMKIVTHQDVKIFFEKEGYGLLSEYKMSKEKLDFKCPNNHYHSMSWASFRKGARCRHCTYKHHFDDIKSHIEGNNYKVLSTECKNSEEKLDLICPNNHSVKISFLKFKDGVRCIHCLKHDIEFIRDSFAKEGYTLLTENYKNSKQKLEYSCSKEHIGKVSFNSFQAGNRCTTCKGLKVNKNDVDRYIESQGFALLSGGYKNARTKVTCKCSFGHVTDIRWEGFDKPIKCQACEGRRRTEDEKKLVDIASKVRHRLSSHLKRYMVKEGKLNNRDIKLRDYFYLAEPIYRELGKAPKGFHLDHIVPVSFFDLRNKEELDLCWHPANLRYITPSENSRKSNRLTIDDINNFSKQQIIILLAASNKPKPLEAYCLNLQQELTSNEK